MSKRKSTVKKRPRKCSPNQSVNLDLGVESLENRQMLAGNVTATITGAGHLVISGDAADNTVAVSLDAAGNVEVNGFDGTTVDSTNLSTAQLTGDIRISLKGGNDSVAVYGSGYDIPVDNISILSGTGNDQSLISNVNGIDGNVTINSGTGNDSSWVKYSSASGDVTINSASGNDTNVFQEVNAEDLSIKSGSGADSDFVYYSTATGTITVASTTGNDDVNIYGALASNLRVSTGSGDDQVFIDETDTKYDVTANTGGGNDKFVITNAEVSGDLNVNSGAGNDQLCMKYLESGSTRVATGAGDDVFEMGEVDLGVASNLNLGGGADSLSVIGPVAGTGTLNGGAGFDGIDNSTAIGGLGLTSFEKYA